MKEYIPKKKYRSISEDKFDFIVRFTVSNRNLSLSIGVLFENLSSYFLDLIIFT